MDFAHFAQQMAVARECARDLRRQAGAVPDRPAASLDPALARLIDSLDGLQTAEQLLREQADELRRGRDAIEAERQRYRALFEFAPDGYLVTDRHGSIQEANWAAGILLNEPEESLVCRSLPQFVAPGEAAAFQVEMQRLDGVDGVREWETRLQPRDYATFDASVAVVPDRDHTGHVVGLRWLLRDITTRRHAAEQVQALMAELEQRVRERTAQLEAANRDLHATNEVLQALVQSSPLAIVVLDQEGRVTTWSPAAEALFGWTAQDVIGRLPPYIVSDEAHAQLEHISQQTGQAVELRRLRRDGTVFEVSAWSAPLQDTQGRLFGSMRVYIDIGERKRAQAQIAYQAHLLDNVHDAVIATDEQHRLTAWNRAAEQMYGWSAREALGRPAVEVLRPLPGSTLRAGQLDDAPYGRLLRGHGRQDAIHLRRDGEPLHVGETVMTLKSDSGQVTGYVSVIRDISDRKRAEAEIRALNASLERRVAERTAELEVKNRELESFTYSVSHDLKAPLRGIDGFSRLLQQDQSSQLDAEGRSNLARISSAVNQMYQLIDDLLAYSRIEQRAVTTGPVNLTRLVGALVEERAAELKHRGIRVTVAIACGMATADADGLAQAFRNLLDNALKFTYSIPNPHIEIRGTEHGDRCTLSICDNGIGFDMQHHDRIFGIFQRLHRAEEFPGTGIGLAIVHKAMRRMNGNVWAESAAGQGACFHLEIPK